MKKMAQLTSSCLICLGCLGKHFFHLTTRNLCVNRQKKRKTSCACIVVIHEVFCIIQKCIHIIRSLKLTWCVLSKQPGPCLEHIGELQHSESSKLIEAQRNAQAKVRAVHKIFVESVLYDNFSSSLWFVSTGKQRMCTKLHTRDPRHIHVHGGHVPILEEESTHFRGPPQAWRNRSASVPSFLWHSLDLWL